MSGGSGLSPARLTRLRDVMNRHVDSGQVPGLVALVARRGEAHVTVAGTMEADGRGGPMTRDAIFRLASVTKQITTAAAMILVEECRLRLDDPVDGLLPELASRRVLREPGGPLDDTRAHPAADHAARPAHVPDGVRCGDGTARDVPDPAGHRGRRAGRRPVGPRRSGPRSGSSGWPACRWSTSPGTSGCTTRRRMSSAC